MRLANRQKQRICAIILLRCTIAESKRGERYEHITKLTPEIMHELIEKIVVHEADKTSGKRVQQIDIYYRFDVAVSSVTAETGKYGKKTA